MESPPHASVYTLLLRGNAYTVLRVLIGAGLMFHGVPRLLGWVVPPGAVMPDGPATLLQVWEAWGQQMLLPFDIHGFHLITGFFLGLAETLGGLGLILGLMFRPAAIAAGVAMIGYTALHLRLGTGGWSHPLLLAILCAYFTACGRGWWALDNLLSVRMFERLRGPTIDAHGLVVDPNAATRRAPPVKRAAKTGDKKPAKKTR